MINQTPEQIAGAAIQAPALYRSVGITAERVGIVLPYVVVLLDLRRLMRLGMSGTCWGSSRKSNDGQSQCATDAGAPAPSSPCVAGVTFREQA